MSGEHDGSGPPEIRDSRRPGFFWIGLAASDALRGQFGGRELATARAIYSALAEIANEARSDEFTASRRRVATYAGVSDRTLDRYAQELEALGLLLIERRSNGSQHLPNLWHLIDREKAGGQSGKVVSLRARGGEAASPPGEANRGRGGEANDTRFKKNGKKLTTSPSSKRSRGGRDLARFDEATRR
jgi:hypothetical protein